MYYLVDMHIQANKMLYILSMFINTVVLHLIMLLWGRDLRYLSKEGVTMLT